MQKYRAFVTHASAQEDRQYAYAIRKRLADIGVQPILAEFDLSGGHDFLQGIQESIRHSHLLIPVLTEFSHQRPWVNHEIGFAIGSSVPLLPVTIGVIPEGLAETLHAVKFQDRNDFHLNLIAKLSRDVVDRLFVESVDNLSMVPVYECAESPSNRCQMFSRYLRGVAKFGRGPIRQKTPFGTFSIPAKLVPLEPWTLREGHTPRTDDDRKLMCEERIQIGEHARECGCSLIMKPSVRITTAKGREDKVCRAARRVRLELIREFLVSMADRDGLVQVAIVPPEEKIWGNLTIVGDWFLADAVSPLHENTYRKTMFTRHAPTILRQIEEFDREVKDRIAGMPLAGTSSREFAIHVIDQILEELSV